jgi:ligand-binding SRPBCC domain-containing protein
MHTFRLERQIDVPRPRDEIFPFFAEAANLEVLTPPWLRFRIVTPQPVRMAQGTRIDYHLSLRGLPMAWTSEITVWDPPYRFIDEQIRGPYRIWVHEHLFEPIDGGTRILDRVDYAVPGGAFVRRLFVLPQLTRIFDYRHHVMQQTFGTA